MKRLFRKWLMGDTVFSAYSKITMADTILEKVFLQANGRIIDVSALHWILCIEPIVFGIWLEKDTDFMAEDNGRKYQLHFTDASLHLSFFNSVKDENGTLLLLKLEKSRIYHVPFIKTWLLFVRYFRTGGLTFKRFKGFVSAYSYPRRVRLISFRQGDYYNIFPMDLMGDISQRNRYVFGLRHTNIALAKIIETGKMVVSEVAHEYKDTLYELGKHHSSIPPPLDTLSFTTFSSKSLGFPVPTWVESYKEINILKHLDMGSHVLLWGEIASKNNVNNPVEHLYTVHFLHYLHQKNKGRTYKLV